MKDDFSFSRVAQANDVYELEKQQCGFTQQVIIRRIEKRFGLKPNQLAWWRANNLSKKGLLECRGSRPGNL